MSDRPYFSIVCNDVWNSWQPNIISDERCPRGALILPNIGKAIVLRGSSVTEYVFHDGDWHEKR